MRKSYILSCGSYLPKKIVSNEELSKTIDTSDEWIFTRTGIKNRHIADAEETTSFMATEAAKQAISRVPEIASQIDAVICATTTPDQIFPSTATKIQSALGLAKGCAFDLQAVCSGFLYGLTLADSLIKSGQVTTALVIGAEKMSSIVNWQDRGTCVLFGDGAGAVIVSKTENSQSLIIDSHLCADGDLGCILYTDDSGIVMNGREVFRHGIEKMSSEMESLLTAHNLTSADIDWVIPHQANLRMITAIAERLQVPMEKIVVSLQNQANTSAATIPLALCQHFNDGKLKRGDLILMAAAGGGFTWGATLLRW